MSETMSDQETAETLAEGTTTTDAPATPVNDGIIDLDAPEEVKDEAEEKSEGEEKPEAAAKPEDEEEKKKLSGAQRAKLREQRLRDELSAREREIEELRRSAPAANASESEEKAPREEDYPNDWFAWQQALTAFNAGQAAGKAIDKRLGAREQAEREAKQAEIARERKIAHSERVEDAREVIADFDQVMSTMKGVNVRNDVIDEIMSSDNSALLSYHLAKNPDKLNALNQMSGRELAREMGRLEATVKMPEAKKATSAPAPLSRPRGGTSPSNAEADLQSWLKKTYPGR
jgi:hypothetical protein